MKETTITYKKSEILQAIMHYQKEIEYCNSMLEKDSNLYKNRIIYAEIAISAICEKYNIENKKITYSEILEARKDE